MIDIPVAYGVISYKEYIKWREFIGLDGLTLPPNSILRSERFYLTLARLEKEDALAFKLRFGIWD